MCENVHLTKALVRGTQALPTSENRLCGVEVISLWLVFSSKASCVHFVPIVQLINELWKSERRFLFYSVETPLAEAVPVCPFRRNQSSPSSGPRDQAHPGGSRRSGRGSG